MAEEDGLATAGFNFFHFRRQPVELTALAGQWVVVADLLEAEDKLENVLDCDRFAEVIQLHNAISLGNSIGQFLSGSEVEKFVAVESRGEIGEDSILGAAKHKLASKSIELPDVVGALVGGRANELQQ